MDAGTQTVRRNGMRTPEEIIKGKYPFYDPNTYGKDVELDGDNVIELMEQYADQFKQVSVESDVILPERNYFGQWIDIKKQRPEQQDTYLVQCEYGICTATYGQWGNWAGDNFAEESSNSVDYIDVTHWMPLPNHPYTD